MHTTTKSKLDFLFAILTIVTCVSTFATETEDSIPYTEHIHSIDTFWDDCVMKSKVFFTICLLPEILGNWYT